MQAFCGADASAGLVLHTQQVSSSSKLCGQEHGLDAGDDVSLQDFIVGHVLLPLDAHDGSKARTTGENVPEVALAYGTEPGLHIHTGE